MHTHQVLQHPSQEGVYGICSSDDAVANLKVCESLQATFITGTALSFALVMLSVILCLGVAVHLDAWIAPALVFFQFSLLALAMALTAAAKMLLPHGHATVVSAFMAIMAAGSLFALRPPMCLGYYYMCFHRHGNMISDIFHWTLQTSRWGLFGKLHIVRRKEMIWILISCGANVNAVQRYGPLPVTPIQRIKQPLAPRNFFPADDTQIITSTAGNDQPAAESSTNCQSQQFWKCSKTPRNAQGDRGMAVASTPLMTAVANVTVSSDVVQMLLDWGKSAVLVSDKSSKGEDY
jgi:hypothetical protein